VLFPFFIALFITYLLNPLVTYIENKGIPRVISIFIIYFALILIIAAISVYIIPLFTTEINNLIEIIPQYTKAAQEILLDFKEKYKNTGLPKGVQEVIDQNINALEGILLNILETILNSIIKVFTGFFSFILAPVLAFYLLKDLETIKQKAVKIIPAAYRKSIIRLLVEVDKTLGKYIRGQLIVSSLVALMTTLGLLFLKIDYAIIIGAVAGISNIIPYFGPIIGAIPAIAIASLKSPASVLWVIIILIAVQQIESGIISPKVMGDSIGLHPVIVILTLIFGGKVFGFWGIILIMPVVAVIKAVITFMINNITGVDKE